MQERSKKGQGFDPFLDPALNKKESAFDDDFRSLLQTTKKEKSHSTSREGRRFFNRSFGVELTAAASFQPDKEAAASPLHPREGEEEDGFDLIWGLIPTEKAAVWDALSFRSASSSLQPLAMMRSLLYLSSLCLSKSPCYLTKKRARLLFSKEGKKYRLLLLLSRLLHWVIVEERGD